MRDVRNLTSTDWWILDLMLAAQTTAFVIAPSSVFALMAGLLTCVSLIFCDRGMSTTYPSAIGANIAAIVVSASTGLLGDVLSRSLMIILSCVGIILWSGSSDDTGIVVPRKLSRKGWLLAAGAIMGLYLPILSLSLATGASSPWLASLLLPLTLVAEILMLKGYSAQWQLWLALDGINVLTWLMLLLGGAGASAVSMLALNAIMAINGIYGFIVWKRMLSKEEG